jgi:hypothetical protein
VPVAYVEHGEPVALDGARLQRQELHQEAQRRLRLEGQLARRRAPAHRRPHAGGRGAHEAAVLAVVVALCDLQHEPALELRQRHRRALLRLTLLATLGRVARGAGQAPEPLHERAVEALHVAAEVRPAHRAVRQLDAVLGAARAQRAALELRGVVQVQAARHAVHRPVGLDAERLQPRRFGQHHARDQQRDDGGVGPLQRHVKAHDTARGHVDGQRDPWTADGLAQLLVHDDEVGLGMVDLHQFQRRIGHQVARRNLGTRRTGAP